ncbi:MAG: pyruvate ferredoxin oxidoreductase, partial [Deltaproteobacteria bacterium]
IPTSDSIRYGRLAVDTGVFPLYEVVDGKYRMTYEPQKLRPVEDYLKGQGRFRHLGDKDIEKIQRRVSQEYEKILSKCEGK